MIQLPTLTGQVPRDAEVALKRLRDHGDVLEAALAEVSARVVPPLSLQDIQQALSATGVTPLNITGLPGGLSSIVLDDTSTNATEYPTFVRSVSGNVKLYVSSSKLTYNPAFGSVGIGRTPSTTTALSVGSAIGEALQLLRPLKTANATVTARFNLTNSNDLEATYAAIQGMVTTNTAAAEAGTLLLLTATAGTLTEQVRINNLGNVGMGTGATISARVHALATTEQLRLGYNAGNFNSFTVTSVGSLTIAATGTNPNIALTPSGLGVVYLNANVGIGASLVGAKVHITATTEQLRVAYDASNYVSFTVASVGSLNLAAVGTNPNITLTPSGTGAVGISTATPKALLDVNGYIRSLSANGSPATGAGMEMTYAAGVGYLQAYDHTGVSYMPANLDGSTLSLNVLAGGQINLGGIPKFGGSNTSAAGTPLLGANSPATTLSAPYTWIVAIAADGTTIYIPAWK